MQCAACGATVTVGQRFCPGCGTSTAGTTKCAKCGTLWPPDGAFCTWCGAPPDFGAQPAETTPALSPQLVAALDSAAAACTSALDEFLQHRIGVAELERRLFDAGVVKTDGELWLLDVANGRWCRYRGGQLWLDTSSDADPSRGTPA